MLMSLIWTFMVFFSILAALISGRGGLLSAAVSQGAQAGVTLAISIGGSLCLWSGVGKVMEAAGISGWLSRRMRPLLSRIFPSAKTDTTLSGYLSANAVANLLGLGNAATPMGIAAAKRLSIPGSERASNQLCRLIVLNTASIQLIPATVAGVRASLGAKAPFDILPAVWITSLCSAGLGLIMAFILGKIWRK